MKKFMLIIATLVSNEIYAQSWLSETNFPGQKGNDRGWTINAIVGNKLFIGMGYTQVGTPPYLFNDFWEYNLTTKQWTQRPNFPGGATSGAVAFVIGDKIYAGLVATGFYEYNTTTNAWRTLPNLPQYPERQGAIAFVIAGKGYVSCGRGYSTEDSDENKRDLWSYDPVTEVWSRKADIPGQNPSLDPTGLAVRRFYPIGFALNGKGYVGGGINRFGNYLKDFWEYDPALNTWTYKGDIPDPLGHGGLAESISTTLCDRAYLIGGASTSNYWVNARNVIPYWYEYNPSTNAWTQKSPDLPGAILAGAGFSSNGYIYAGLAGRSFYKISQFSITGTSPVCASETFSIDNLPTGLSINWASDNSSGLSINSATGLATRQSGFNGEVTITATLNGACSFTKKVRVGTPPPTGISGPNYNLCRQRTHPNEEGTFYVHNPLPEVVYNWQFVKSTGQTLSLGSDLSVTINASAPFYTAGTHTLRLRSFSCGQYSPWYSGTVIIEKCSTTKNFNMYPNPANDQLYVETGIDMNGCQSVGVQLIDSHQKVMYDTCLSDEMVCIPTSHLPEGNYFLNVKTCEGIIQKRVIVERK